MRNELPTYLIPSISSSTPNQLLNRVRLKANRTNVRTAISTSNSSNAVSLVSNTTISSHVGMLCPIFYAGLGNHIFQFASTFGIAKAKNMTLLVNRWSPIYKVFNLNVTLVNDDNLCKSFEIRREKFPATFDKHVIDFNSSKSLRLGYFLQSWKYFYSFRDELRTQLQFRKVIRNYAEKIISKIYVEIGVKNTHVTLIGVHVRRGDMLKHKLGFNVAPAKYLKNAVNYFQRKYENIIFIVASNGMKWTKKNMPENLNVRYLNGSAENDMAVLASCNHVITTVGSFGWWSGWLSGGEVTYYKFPAKTGSWFYKGINHEDYFFPGWVGL